MLVQVGEPCGDGSRNDSYCTNLERDIYTGRAFSALIEVVVLWTYSYSIGNISRIQ
jgi:hypothetical protein